MTAWIPDVFQLSQDPALRETPEGSRSTFDDLAVELLARGIVDVSLRDGTVVRIRPVRRDDKARLIEGFARLSPRSRYRRFLTPVERLTEDQLSHLTEIDYVNHYALGAVLPGKPGEPAVGIARYVRLGRSDVAEVAVTVIDEYQGRGLGRLLFRLISSVALNRGINRLCAYTLADNLPVRRELARVGASMQWDSGGLIRAEMDVRAALKENEPGP